MRFRGLVINFSASLLVGSAVAAAQPVTNAVQNAVERQAEQAQERAVERAQEQARDRVQEQAAGRVQEQTAEQVADQVVERAVGRAQDQAAERSQQQAAERTQEQAVDRVLDQAIDRVQGQAGSAQNQAQERVRGGQAARVQEQLLERTQGQLERVSQRPDQGSGSNAAADALRLPDAARQALDRIPGPSPMANLPDRLPIADEDGGEVFVEIAIEPNIRVLEREWVMLLTGPQRTRLINEAPALMQYLAQTSNFAEESYLLQFRVPPDLDADDQILELVPDDLRDLIDRNHVYSAQSAALDTSPDSGDGKSPLPLPMNAVCEDAVSVGVIDSMINIDHPAFARPTGSTSGFVSREFVQDRVDRHSGHGTAVAGVLIGRGQGHGYDLAPLLPNATLYNASVVYSQDAYHQGATVMHLLEAISWMLAQDDIRVINMSLTGPANRLLERAVATVLAQDKIIVAAAGNEGPHAGLLYPAAYEGVVATSAVADDRTVYRWAAQGKHLDFTALGVSVPTARGDGGFGRESGTSMAAPIVSAFFACALANDSQRVSAAREALINQASDLGATGHDPVFGHGLLHP
ncbi:MAG: S8 family serine peptidase [Pseudohongiella sp.]